MAWKKASRTTTDLEVLGLPLAVTWEIVPAPSWDAEDDVGGEDEGDDRLGREHGYCRRRAKSLESGSLRERLGALMLEEKRLKSRRQDRRRERRSDEAQQLRGREGHSVHHIR